mgnify:CR=1 FL=1
MNIFDRFMEVLRALDIEEVEYILVGGYALILNGLPRITRDIDLFIKPEERNVAKSAESCFQG